MCGVNKMHNENPPPFQPSTAANLLSCLLFLQQEAMTLGDLASTRLLLTFCILVFFAVFNFFSPNFIFIPYPVNKQPQN